MYAIERMLDSHSDKCRLVYLKPDDDSLFSLGGIYYYMLHVDMFDSAYRAMQEYGLVPYKTRTYGGFEYEMCVKILCT